MSYSYNFDRKTVGDIVLPSSGWRTLHNAIEILNDELMNWNQKVGDGGAQKIPYEQEVQDLDKIMRSIRSKLERSPHDNFLVEKEVSLGSQRLSKAALTLLLCRQFQNLSDKKSEGWPSAALDSLNEEIKPITELLGKEQFDCEPHEVLWQLISKEQSVECQSQIEPSKFPL